MKLPSSVRIAGITYKVKHVPLIDEEPRTLGWCDPLSQTIKIKEGLSEERERIVFLHEVIHAVFDEYSIEPKDDVLEQVTEGLAKGLSQALGDNLKLK
jgi:hypothetical protein